MTEQELLENINKSRRQSNYYNIVRHLAYDEMMDYNRYIKRLHNLKKELREQNLITEDTWDKTQIYSYKSKKFVCFTVYTKIPKFRSYKQQLAILGRQLEQRLLKRLKDLDNKAIEAKKYTYDWSSFE